jgi:ribosome maturation factor RimP
VGVEEAVRAQIMPILDDLGVELLDVNWGGARLRLTVDTESGISSSELTTATRNISHELDETDPIPGKFTLEVSSPGLERPLRRPDHFVRAVGGEVSVKLNATAAEDGERRIRGVLTAADEAHIEIDTSDGGTRIIDLADISKARTVFEWGQNSKEATTR